ncbi:unnamed protein product [Adineta steineri]|uniref:Ubiquitin-like domain-containing protein n=1 Tax=Adineta steineri TaxID=433720 RepID=A0A820IK97_9BILA|nr:unnamed protein product [Adineta steineri]
MTSINNKLRCIKLQIQYGSDLYELLLSSKDNKIQVEQVLNEIEKLTKIPQCHQTLIYKGQRLDHKPNEDLEDLYIFNNSKLILSKTQRSSHDKCDYLNLSSQKQQNNTDLIGFTPEPNKNYE